MALPYRIRMTEGKDSNLIVRLTDRQKGQIETAARRSGLTLSDYVRAVLAISSQSKHVGAWLDSSISQDLGRSTGKAGR